MKQDSEVDARLAEIAKVAEDSVKNYLHNTGRTNVVSKSGTAEDNIASSTKDNVDENMANENAVDTNMVSENVVDENAVEN